MTTSGHGSAGERPDIAALTKRVSAVLQERRLVTSSPRRGITTKDAKGTKSREGKNFVLFVRFVVLRAHELVLARGVHWRSWLVDWPRWR
jgi:hypothetical protein